MLVYDRDKLDLLRIIIVNKNIYRIICCVILDHRMFLLARVAQLAEHVIRNDEVVGSTPIAGFFFLLP